MYAGLWYIIIAVDGFLEEGRRGGFDSHEYRGAETLAGFDSRAVFWYCARANLRTGRLTMGRCRQAQMIPVAFATRTDKSPRFSLIESRRLAASHKCLERRRT